MTMPITVFISIDEFLNKIEVIKRICHKNKAKEIWDASSDTIIFYFYSNESWMIAKQEIQRTVEHVNFKLATKRVIIMKEMKDIIVEPPQPPPWFLEFQQAVFARFDKQDKRFDQIEADIGKLKADIKKMDTTRPTWFSQWVKSEFDPLKHRIDNIVKLNNLKE